MTLHVDLSAKPTRANGAYDLDAADARAILAALHRIEARLDRVEALATKASADAKGALAALGDTFDGVMGRLQAAGVDPDERLKNLIIAADKLTSPRVLALLESALSRSDELRAVLDSGILDPQAVAIVSKAGGALAEAAAHPHSPVGTLGLLRAMRSQDFQWASGFLIRFAQRMGRTIMQDARPALPAAAGEASK